jgi:predicted DCC family thiol-disulfide oxidoreductase YuxK
VSSDWPGGTLPALSFDDACPLCTRSAWFIDRHDRRRALRFVALASDEGRALRAAPPRLADVESLIWLEPAGEGGTSALAYSAAVLRVGRYLGGRWALLSGLAWAVPRPIRDAIYKSVARHRK